MKHKFSLIWRVAVALVLVLSFSLVAAVPAMADVETFYVDPILGNDSATQGTGQGYDAFETIQYAIDHVSTGDTIELAEGTYDLTATIDLSKAITLNSESGAAYTILKPVSDELHAIIVTVSGSATSPVVIDGLTFTRKELGTEFDYAIWNNGFDHMTVKDCVFNYVIPDGNSDHEAVIYVQTKGGAITSCTISDNTFTNCCDDPPADDALLDHPGRAATIGCRTTDGSDLTGLTISGNELINCDGYGIELKGSSSKLSATVTNNTFTNCASSLNVSETKGADPFAGRVTITGNTFTNASNYGINVEGGNNQVEIKNNTITGTTGNQAVMLDASHTGTTHVVQYNNIYDNTLYGVSAKSPKEQGTPPYYDCQHNWWGTTDEPEIKAMILYRAWDGSAYVDAIVTDASKVDYVPWLTSPYSAAAITSPAIAYPAGAIAARPGEEVTVSATVTESASVTLSAAEEIFDDMTEVDGTFTVAMTMTGTAAAGLCEFTTGALTVADGVEDGSYPLTITATGPCDEEDIESLSLEVQQQVTSFAIDLYEGWNLMSLPLIPDDTDITVVISDDTLDSGDVSSVGSVRGYDPVAETFSLYEPGVGGALTIMEDGYGYWVFMDAADTLTVSGKVIPDPPATPPTYDVVVGWNLIGFKSVVDAVDYVAATTGGSPVPAHGYLLNIAGTYPVLWSYDAEAEAYSNVKDVALGMEVGHGFWLWAEEGGTIVPPA